MERENKKMIKVTDVKRGQIFMKNNTEYIVTNIYTCLTKHNKLGFTAINQKTKESILEFYPFDYELHANDNYILLKSN